MFNLFSNKKEELNYKELVKQGAIILDVRSKQEFDGGHIKGALNIPLPELQQNLSLLGGKEKHIITCCMSGGRSNMAKDVLLSVGYVHIYNGGGWQSLQKNLL